MRSDKIKLIAGSGATKLVSMEEIHTLNEDYYYHTMLDVTKMHRMGFTGRGMKIAILDTGIDTDHPVFEGKIVAKRNFTNEGSSTNVEDKNGHGTHCASLAAGLPYGTFKGGVAKDASLVICKVMDGSGDGDYNMLINAIDFCIKQKVDVISMSLGGTVADDDLHNACKKAVEAGIMVCVASGNDADVADGGTDEYQYPGSYPEVVEVGSIDSNRTPSYYSNSNNELDCVCYGDDILAAYMDGDFAYMSGTSMATPLAAGCALLLKQWFKVRFGRVPSEAEVYGTLTKCCRNIRGCDRKQIGYGYINLGAIEY